MISDLRREVFGKFLTLPVQFFDSQPAGPLLSRMTYNVEMVAESVTSVVTIAVRDILTVIAAIRRHVCITARHLTIFVAILFPIVAPSCIPRCCFSSIQQPHPGFDRRSDASDRRDRSRQRGGESVSWLRLRARTLHEVDERNRKQNLKLIRVRSMGVAVTQIVFGFGIALVIYIAGRNQ